MKPPKHNIPSKNKLVPSLSEPAPSRKTYVHFTGDGRGNIISSIGPAKDWASRKLCEGRAKQIMPHRARSVRMKNELWNGNSLINFFRQEQIRADTTPWFIAFLDPARKMSVHDQLVLMLAHGDTEYEIQINRDKKHVIIDKLEGNL